MIKILLGSITEYSIKYKRFTVIFILMAIVAAGSGVVSVWAMGEMAQAAEFHISREMTRFLIVLAVTGIVQAIISGIMAWTVRRYSGNTGYAVRKGFCKRLLKASYKQIASKSSGEGVSLFTADVPTATGFLSTNTFGLVSQIATLLVTAAFMFYINWWLSLIYFALYPMFVILQERLSRPIAKKFEEVSKRRADYNEVVKDSLQNPLTVLAYNLESQVDKRFSTSFSKYYKTLIRAEVHVTLIESVGIITTQIPVFVLYFTSAALVINGQMAIAELIALIIVSRPLGDWLQNFAWQMALLQESSAAAKRVVEFVSREEDMQGIGVIKDEESVFAVSFNDVSFCYAEDAEVVSKLSFQAENGRITAIIGASGCGKSTVLKLLLGLYKQDDGEITVSSNNITYVPQDCHLLPVSIRENILAGLSLDNDKLIAACKNAGILGFIEELSDGFDSVLTESAANISGGQKQRIALARAFYVDADILLFDEATSSLDIETERSILNALSKYVNETQKTAIVVAHRQAVQDVADKVLNLDDEYSRSEVH